MQPVLPKKCHKKKGLFTELTVKIPLFYKELFTK